MEGFLPYIGTFISVIFVSLLILMGLVIVKLKYERTRKEIVKTLSFMIGQGKRLDIFDISTVYNSKSRGSNLNTRVYTELAIIEDLITEVISNPLLDIELKYDIIRGLQSLIYNNYIRKEGHASLYDEKPYSEITIDEIDNAQLKRKGGKNGLSFFVNIFSAIAGIVSIFITIIDFSTSFEIVENTTAWSLIVSISTAVIALIITLVINKLYTTKESRRP